jgi:hypothetical protein
MGLFIEARDAEGGGSWIAASIVKAEIGSNVRIR